MCSSKSTSRDAARRDRDARAARRARRARLPIRALPLRKGFDENAYHVTDCSNLQMIIHRKAKSDGSEKKYKTLGEFLNSRRELNFN